MKEEPSEPFRFHLREPSESNQEFCRGSNPRITVSAEASVSLGDSLILKGRPTFPDHDPLPVGFRWAAPPQRELAAVTGSAAPRETSESQRGAGVGETDRDEPRRRLGNGTLPLQAAYSHVPIRIRSGVSTPDILTTI